MPIGIYNTVSLQLIRTQIAFPNPPATSQMLYTSFPRVLSIGDRLRGAARASDAHSPQAETRAANVRTLQGRTKDVTRAAAVFWPWCIGPKGERFFFRAASDRSIGRRDDFDIAVFTAEAEARVVFLLAIGISSSLWCWCYVFCF